MVLSLLCVRRRDSRSRDDRSVVLLPCVEHLLGSDVSTQHVAVEDVGDLAELVRGVLASRDVEDLVELLEGEGLRLGDEEQDEPPSNEVPYCGIRVRSGVANGERETYLRRIRRLPEA
jgi:hypothetical protein